jgi:VIT1/CCC1 family predicted Fe2+/Mn2+ transporter
MSTATPPHDAGPGPGDLVSLTAEDARRYRGYLLAEWDASTLYRRLADAERDPERAEVLRELASVEDRHAARWQDLLSRANQPLPDRHSSLRSRALAGAARLLGTRAVLPLIERPESGDADMYAQEPAAQDFSVDERNHARVFAALASGASAGTAFWHHERRHRGAGGGSLRAAVFGVNDGLVSNLSLVMGVAGAEAGPSMLVLAGVAGLLAGAFSMATGEYVSMRVQRELFERELAIETEELETMPEEEEAELALIYRAKGLPREDAERIAHTIIADRATALDTLAREELGLDPSELGSPWGAAVSSFLAFSAGALLPVLPYLLLAGPSAFQGSVALSGLALAAVGGFTALLTGRSLLYGAARMLLLGAASATVTFLVGRLLGVALAG